MCGTEKARKGWSGEVRWYYRHYMTENTKLLDGNTKLKQSIKEDNEKK